MVPRTGTPQRSPCRTCGAEILWLKHVHTGKLAPIDALPNPAGNILIQLDHGTYLQIPNDERSQWADWLHTNHFQTCPQAGEWKRHGSIREVQP